MAQNVYDDPAFFDRYMQLRRQTHGLNGAPEWRAVRAMLPDIAGRRVLDLGCGLGWFARWAKAQGAMSVLGLDISKRMLERARRETADDAVEYRVADLEHLELPPASVDLVYSSLAFHYVQEFARLVGVIHSTLVPGGWLVFIVEHPIYTAAANPHWIQAEDGRKAWPVNRYSIEGERHVEWLGTSVRKYHRTIATTANTLLDSGFRLRRLEEFAPTAAQIAETPELEEEVERPMLLIVAAQR